MVAFQPSFACLMSTSSLPSDIQDATCPLSDAPPHVPASPDSSASRLVYIQTAPTTAPGTQQQQQGAAGAGADRDAPGQHAAFYLPNPAPCERDSEYSTELRPTLSRHEASGIDTSVSTPGACENGLVRHAAKPSVNVFQGISTYTDDYTQKSAAPAQSPSHEEVRPAPSWPQLLLHYLLALSHRVVR